VAGGSVHVAHEINNCSITAGRMVVATRGRGKIFGGSIFSVEGVEANEIGSPVGVETTIIVGKAPKVDDTEKKQRDALKQRLDKIYSVLGREEPHVILMRVPEAKRMQVMEVLSLRAKSEKELKALDEKLLLARENRWRLYNARIKVRQVIYPGVVINCYGKVLKVADKIEHSQLYFDYDNRELVVTSL